MSKDSLHPKIEPKLTAQHNYAQWILSIEQTLSIYDYDYLGNHNRRKREPRPQKHRQRKKHEHKDNNFAILTMKRNCEPEVVNSIGLRWHTTSWGTKYEGKTDVIKLSYDDLTMTIDAHIDGFEQMWGFMEPTVAGAIPGGLKDFEEVLLQKLSPCDQAKAEFLFASLQYPGWPKALTPMGIP